MLLLHCRVEVLLREVEIKGERVHPAGSGSSVSHPEDGPSLPKILIISQRDQGWAQPDCSEVDSCFWGRAQDLNMQIQVLLLSAAGSMLEPKPNLKGRFSGLKSRWVESPAQHPGFLHFRCNPPGEEQLDSVPTNHHPQHSLELLLQPRRYRKALLGKTDISDFKEEKNVWIVVDWLKQMILLHVLVVWFLRLREYMCDTAAGVQQVSTRSLVAL